jgi:hypothetical protein
VQLFLTPKAEPILADLGIAASDVHATATAGLSAAECERLIAMLGIIKHNLQSDELVNQQIA